MLANPDTQAVLFLDLVVDGIHKDEGVDAFQGPVLPGIDLRHNLLADFAYQFRRNFNVIQTLDLLCDVPLAHATGVEGQNLILHTFSIAVVLADDFGFVVALTVAWGL